MTKSIMALVSLLVSFANSDDVGAVQVALTQRTPQSDCEVTVYEHFAPSEKPEYTGEFQTFKGEGTFSLADWAYGVSSVVVTGAGCQAYGHKTGDCSGDKGKPIGADVVVDGQPAGVVSTSKNLEQFWCNDCVQCVRVEKGGGENGNADEKDKADDEKKATPAPKQVPKCTGCAGSPNECWTPCNQKGGLCSACDSKEGTPGACCLANAPNGVKVHATEPNAEDDQVCKSIPLSNFDYKPWKETNYHMCVLTLANAPEFPKCTGCGDRDMECWETCGGMGPCAACDSAQGTKGACCRVNTDADGGDYSQGSPPECTGVPKYAYAYKGYHMCVLQTEVPQCTGCAVRELECWGACGDKSGYCDACNALTPQEDQDQPWLKGSKGACCRMDLTDAGPQMTTGAADDPCKQVPVSSFPYYGYHLCVLAPPADATPS